MESDEEEIWHLRFSDSEHSDDQDAVDGSSAVPVAGGSGSADSNCSSVELERSRCHEDIHNATAQWVFSQSLVEERQEVIEARACVHVPQKTRTVLTVHSYVTKPDSESTVHSYETKSDSLHVPTVHSYETKDTTYESYSQHTCTVHSYETLTSSHSESDEDENVNHVHKEPSPPDMPEQEVPQPKRRKFRNIPIPTDLLQKECCIDKCMKHLTIHDIETCQLLIENLNEDEQLNYVLKEVTSHTLLNRRESNFKKQIFHFIIGGKEVCYEAWCFAFNVSLKRFKKAVTGFREGVQQFEHGNRGRRRQTVKTSNALGWMRHYFERIGDYMPHKTKVHLPMTWTKGGLYKKMKGEFVSRGLRPKDIVSASYFAQLWNQHLPEFIIPKKSEFTKCATCTKLDLKTIQAKGTQAANEVKKLKKEHNDLVANERAAYHTIREQAHREPDLYTVMIVDGMDQSKTDIPRLVKNKETAPLNKLHVHLTGVLLHTKSAEGKIPFIYTDVKEVPHDSNTTINIILKTLIEHKEKLGEILFLQLDNCYRENKNKYMLCFASLLVELEIFKEVIVHFLPVGHTHEDVDQMFSRIALWLGLQNAVYTLLDLEQVIMESFTPTISVRSATPQYDFKEWIAPHMAGKFSNHSQPLWFKFVKDDGVTRMHYKMWRKDEWLPKKEFGADGETALDDSLGLVCLKSIPDITCPPEWVIPSLYKLDVDDLKKDLPRGYADHMPRNKQLWWQDYMDNLDDLTKVPESPKSWPLQELTFRIRQKKHVWEPDEQLERIRDKIHLECAVVCIGKQGVNNPRAVKHVDNYETIKTDDLVAVNLADCDEEQPYLGKITAVQDSEVEVHWLTGAYNKVWSELYRGVGRNRKAVVQTIPIESILLFGFQLTARKRLYQTTVTDIKKMYSDLDEA